MPFIHIQQTILCNNKSQEENYMPKKLTYRKPRNGVAEQYGINLSKKMLNDMGVFPDNREVQVEYDREKKVIKIKKTENKGL